MSKLPELHKVTALITRDTPRGRDLLVFLRRDDGMTQLPAGTVEDGEAPDDAILRETAEETGLTAVRVICKLGTFSQPLDPDARLALDTHLLCSAPGESSGAFSIRRGLLVHVQETATDWSRVSYREYDYDPVEEKMTTAWEESGWVPTRILTDHSERHFYHLTPTEPTPERWTIIDGDDNGRVLELYWTPLDGAPVIVPSQRWWVENYREQLGID